MHQPSIALAVLCAAMGVHPLSAQADRGASDLSQLALPEFGGWEKTAQYPADQVGLDAHPGAIEGLFVEFTKPLPSGSMVTYHDLFVDLYRYRTEKQAANVANEAPLSYGDVSRDSILGYEVMLVSHRNDPGTVAEAWLVARHGTLTIEINSAMGGSDPVSLHQLIEEVRAAYRTWRQLAQR